MYLFFSEHRKKEIGFNELIKLLHKQLPFNIITQYIDITQLDHSEMTKMLKNTLTDKGNIARDFFFINRKKINRI